MKRAVTVLYRRRVIDDELDELLPQLAAISIDGAKGVGKTTTALQRATSIFRLDDPDTLEVVRAQPQRLVTAPPPVLIDEWQMLEQSWDLVRRAVDQDQTPGRFILTGSTSPRTPSTHSGAGRIVRLRMRPLSLAERTDTSTSPTVSLRSLLTGDRQPVEGTTELDFTHYVHELIRGGFPAMRELKDRAHRQAIRSYLDRIVDRDFPEAGYTTRNPAALTRWLEAYAAQVSTDASYEAIRDAATSNEGDKPSRSATQPYVDTLQRLWLLEPLPAWIPANNALKRLGKSVKHHLADPALAAGLLRVSAEGIVNNAIGDTPPSVRDGPLAGALFESLLALSLRVYAQHSEAQVMHSRTRNGTHEIDFIVERRDRKVVAIEVKLKQSIEDKDGRHLHWLEEKIGDQLLDKVLITTGKYAYRRQDGIAVVPAALLGP